jgi:preprotein translocase subunit YajC
MAQLLFLLVLFLLMWVFAVRPQQQRVRRHRELVASLRVGDRVVAAGGIVGLIVALDEEEVSLEVAPGVVLRVLRLAVNSRIGPDEPEPEETLGLEDGLGEDEV